MMKLKDEDLSLQNLVFRDMIEGFIIKVEVEAWKYDKCDLNIHHMMIIQPDTVSVMLRYHSADSLLRLHN